MLFLRCSGAIIGIVISFNPNKYFHPNFKQIHTPRFNIKQKLVSNVRLSQPSPILKDEANHDQETSNTHSKLDRILDELVQLVVRDFLLSSINDLVWDKDVLNQLAKYWKSKFVQTKNFSKFLPFFSAELKSTVDGCRKALKKFDYIKFISNDFVHILHQHFASIQHCSR
jgi:hypothetical protein